MAAAIARTASVSRHQWQGTERKEVPRGWTQCESELPMRTNTGECVRHMAHGNQEKRTSELESRAVSNAHRVWRDEKKKEVGADSPSKRASARGVCHRVASGTDTGEGHPHGLLVRREREARVSGEGQGNTRGEMRGRNQASAADTAQSKNKRERMYARH